MRRTSSLKNHLRKLGAVTGVTLLAAVGSWPAPASAAVVGVTTTVALSTTTPAAGQPFTVTLSYSCASVVVDCLGAGVVLNVPAGLDDPSAIQSSAHVATTAFSATSRNIRYTFVNPLPAGSTGQVQFTTAFAMGPTANGAFADFVASMYTSNVGTDASNTVRATATASSRWAAATSVVSQGPIGNDTVFKLNVCDATTTTYGRTNLLDEYFVDALPPRSVFTGASDGGVYDAATHSVRWRLSTLVGPNGCLPSVRVSVNFPDVAFNPGDVVTNNVSGSGHVPGLTALKPVTFVPASVSITLVGPNPVITATKTTTTTNLVPGDKVSYVVSLKNTGNVVLDTVSFTDVLPVGTSILPGGRIGIGNTAGQQVKIYYSTARTPRTAPSFVALGAGGLTGTSTAGSYTTAPNPLPGNASGITALRYLYLGTLNPGQTVSVQIDVVYDDIDDAGAPLAVGTAVNNCAAVRWYYNAALGTTGPCANLVVPTPAPSVQLTMTNCCSTPAPGQTVPWDLTARNNGNVHVADTLVNVFPNGTVVLPGATIGTVTLGSGVSNSVDVYYSTAKAPRTAPTWTLLTRAAVGANRTVTLTAPAVLTGGTSITGMKYVFVNPHRVGETLSARTLLRFTNQYDNGSAIPSGANLVNCVDSTYSYRALNGTAQACGTQVVPAPWLNVLATNNVGNSYPMVNLGATVTLPLQMTDTNSSWYPVVDPVLAEVVSADVVPSGANWAASFVVAAQPGLTFDPAVDFATASLSGGRTALRWNFHGTLVPNSTLRVDLTVKTLQVLWNTQVHQHLHTGGTAPVVPVCAVGTSTLGIGADPENVVGLGTSAQGCKARWGHALTASAALDSSLYVKGALDATYVKYPVTGQSFAGGQGDWRMAISNRGTVPIGSVVVVDKLPTVADTAVVSTAARGSQFSLNLAGAIVPSDPAIKVYYSVAPNPCRAPELGVTVAGCTAANWMSVVPPNPTVVRSVKFDFTSLVLQPKAVFTLDWPMRVPTGTPTGKNAFNSAGFTGTRTDTGARLLASEPIMTGLHVNAPQPNIFGGTTFADGDNDGIRDAGELGIDGITVRLYSSSGTLVGTTITATDFSGNQGTYAFGNLADGTYYAVFDVATIPAYATVSPKDVGSDDTVDSDADPVTGRTADYVFAGLVTNTTIDMGVHLSGCDTVSC